MHQVNLLPSELRVRRGTDKRRQTMVLAGTVVVGAVMVLGGFWYQGWVAERQSQVLSSQLEALDAQLQRVKAARDELELIDGQVKELRALVSQGPQWSQVLQDLEASLPQDTWLTKLQGKGENLVLSGRSATLESVGVLVDNLRSLYYIEEVTLQGVKGVEVESVTPLLEFSLQVKWKWGKAS